MVSVGFRQTSDGTEVGFSQFTAQQIACNRPVLFRLPDTVLQCRFAGAAATRSTINRGKDDLDLVRGPLRMAAAAAASRRAKAIRRSWTK
jgi:hypothetical protein